jgi:hypothetical protein
MFSFYFPFLLLRTEIRNEMDKKTKEKIDESLLTKISVSLKNGPGSIVWTREREEFKYNDQMYDVVKTEINKDTVTYFCLTDNNEKELNDNFCKLVKTTTENDKKAKVNSLSKNLKYISHSTRLLPKYVQTIDIAVLNLFIYDNPYYFDESPPPRFVA